SELRLWRENRPYGVADYRLAEYLFSPGHPYAGDGLGTHNDLVAATLDDLRRFHKTYYSPHNATLFIVRDFIRYDAKRLAERYFGALPRGAWNTSERRANPKAVKIRAPLEKELRKTLRDNVQSSRLTFAWRMPAAYSSTHGATDLLASMLGEGRSSLGQ